MIICHAEGDSQGVLILIACVLKCERRSWGVDWGGVCTDEGLSKSLFGEWEKERNENW